MDPIMHDAERLERALDARAALGDAAAADLSPELQEALAAAQRLTSLRAALSGGPRPSFVQALEDQLRADLRTGAGLPAPRATQPKVARWLLVGSLFLALGLLLGRLLPAGGGSAGLSDSPGSPPGDGAAPGESGGMPRPASADQAAGQARSSAERARRLPLLNWAAAATIDGPTGDGAVGSGRGDAPAVVRGAGAGPANAPQAPARPPADPAAPAAADPTVQSVANPEPAAPEPEDEPEDEPETSPVLPVPAGIEAPAPTPERTPDADPAP